MDRVLLFLLASWGTSSVLARSSQAPPPTGIARSTQATLPDDVDAARALLLSLLGPDAAANATVVRPLMPPGTDPCTPTADNLAAGACSLPRLRGSLPASTPGLAALAALDLSGNNGLTGGLPLSTWQTPWTSLQILNMSYTGLSNVLPMDWSDLPGLTVLDLSQNNIKGTLPSGMAALTSLTWLSVAGNGALSGYLPSAWAALGSLLWLDVRSVCRLCGTTDMFDNLTSGLTAGSHVNTRCRPDECDLDLGNLHGIFQGVLAGFASVMGLCAIVLVIRRVRDCTHGRTYRSVRLSATPASRSHRGSSGGGSGDAAAGGNAAGGGMGTGSTRTRSRRARSHRRRGAGATAASVPLYVVEFEADGTCKWALQLPGVEEMRPDGAGGTGGSDPAGQVAELQRQHQAGTSDVEMSAARRGAGDEGTQPRSEGAASPAALPAMEEPEGAAGAEASSSGAAGTAAQAEPSGSNLRGGASVGSNSGAAARIIAEAISNGEAAEAAARAKAREEGIRQAADAARPPDAVILQPDGFEVCLGSRVAGAPAEPEPAAAGLASAAEAAGAASAEDRSGGVRRQESGTDTCGSGGGSGGSETTGDDTPSDAPEAAGAGGSGAAGPSTPPSGVDTSSVSCTLSSSCTDSFTPGGGGGAGSRRDA
eukprot:XP_001698310.1 predicted protein [Chlamydomonas reinhardtii]